MTTAAAYVCTVSRARALCLAHTLQHDEIFAAPTPTTTAPGDAALTPATVEPTAKVKPKCNTPGKIFLMTFVPGWIAAEHDRSQRVRMLNAILEAVKTETTFDPTGWTDAYVQAKLKKLAAEVRHTRK